MLILFFKYFLKIRRLTYFSIDDEEPPVTREEDIEDKESQKSFEERLRDTIRHERNEPEQFEEPTGAKKIVYWFCGINSFLKNKNKLQTSDLKIDTSIDEDPMMKKICDVNAVIAMAFCGFCYGFFNKYS